MLRGGLVQSAAGLRADWVDSRLGCGVAVLGVAC